MNPDQAEMIPGAIVIQFVDETRHFVGVVLHSNAVELLKKGEQETLEKLQKEQHIPCHIILVLGCFDLKEEWSLFENIGAHPHRDFPWYTFGEKRLAEVQTFREELAFYQALHSPQRYPSLISRKNLRRKSFSLTSKQEGILETVLFVQNYIKGQTDDELLLGRWALGEQGILLLATLKDLFPRDTYIAEEF